MVIGIDGSRAFLPRRTGVEEYSYQVIRNLRDKISGEHEVILYVRKKLVFQAGRFRVRLPDRDFDLPSHWRLRGIWAPRFWTQIGLSAEMLLKRPDVLFVPAHTVPVIHPQRTIVTIHGLEYEFCQDSYSWWERFYMRTSIRFSCRTAETVICVSENTKRDVIRLYSIPESRISVIGEGYTPKLGAGMETPQTGSTAPYFLYIGRLEERKNIVRLIEAFEILKEKLGSGERLVLAGKPGYGYEKISKALAASKYRADIDERGYVSEEEKWWLLRGASVFLFPTLYEGFGLPVLEAQSAGVPVLTSNTSSLPEVGGEGAFYVDPLDVKNIALGMERLLLDEVLREMLIKKAAHNTGRFSWAECARRVSALFTP